jgi:hypothetical protein
MKTQTTHPLTIGYLASNIVEGNGHSLWLGIKEASQAQGVRLVTFAGIELQYPKPFYHQANQVYELVDRQQMGYARFPFRQRAVAKQQPAQRRHFPIQFSEFTILHPV